MTYRARSSTAKRLLAQFYRRHLERGTHMMCGSVAAPAGARDALGLSHTKGRSTFRHGVAVADARGGRASEARGPTDGRGPFARMRSAGTRIRPRRAMIRSRRDPGLPLPRPEAHLREPTGSARRADQGRAGTAGTRGHQDDDAVRASRSAQPEGRRRRPLEEGQAAPKSWHKVGTNGKGRNA